MELYDSGVSHTRLGAAQVIRPLINFTAYNFKVATAPQLRVAYRNIGQDRIELGGEIPML